MSAVPSARWMMIASLAAFVQPTIALASNPKPCGFPGFHFNDDQPWLAKLQYDVQDVHEDWRLSKGQVGVVTSVSEKFVCLSFEGPEGVPQSEAVPKRALKRQSTKRQGIRPGVWRAPMSLDQIEIQSTSRGYVIRLSKAESEVGVLHSGGFENYQLSFLPVAVLRPRQLQAYLKVELLASRNISESPSRERRGLRASARCQTRLTFLGEYLHLAPIKRTPDCDTIVFYGLHKRVLAGS